MCETCCVLRVPHSAIRGTWCDVPHLSLISFGVCSLDLADLVNLWVSHNGPIPQVHWCAGDKSSLSACCNHADCWRVIFCSLRMDISFQFYFRLKCTTSNYVYILCWFCKWTSDWFIYRIFNMSGHTHISSQACIIALMKKKAVFAGVSSLEFNTFSLCHFLSASHDIRNYSALVWIEPGRLGVLLPCSWVSDSNRGKLAVTKAGLGSCCYASETILFHRVFAHCQVNSRQQVITAARNANKAQYSQGQVAVFGVSEEEFPL